MLWVTWDCSQDAVVGGISRPRCSRHSLSPAAQHRLRQQQTGLRQMQHGHLTMHARRPDLSAQGQQQMPHQLIESGVAAVHAERGNGGSSRS